MESLRPLQARYRELPGNPRFVEELLSGGAAIARPMAEKKLAAVKDKVGLG